MFTLQQSNYDKVRSEINNLEFPLLNPDEVIIMPWEKVISATVCVAGLGLSSISAAFGSMSTLRTLVFQGLSAAIETAIPFTAASIGFLVIGCFGGAYTDHVFKKEEYREKFELMTGLMMQAKQCFHGNSLYLASNVYQQSLLNHRFFQVYDTDPNVRIVWNLFYKLSLLRMHSDIQQVQKGCGLANDVVNKLAKLFFMNKAHGLDETDNTKNLRTEIEDKLGFSVNDKNIFNETFSLMNPQAILLSSGILRKEGQIPTFV
jgi:hypothetical protein